MNRFEKCRRILPVSLGLISLAAAGACAAAQAGDVDACRLLTTKQVTAALGIPMDAGVRPNAGDPHICNWRESNKPVGPGRNVMLTLISANEFDTLKKLPMSAPASGAGDEAIVTHTAHVPAILTVKGGTHYFRILVRSSLEASESVDERNQTIEKNLAALILKKLAACAGGDGTGERCTAQGVHERHQARDAQAVGQYESPRARSSAAAGRLATPGWPHSASGIFPRPRIRA